MKADELRRLTQGSSADNLQKALILVYKKLPKAYKDELDGTLAAVLRGEQVQARSAAAKQAKQQKTAADFPSFQDEVERFIDNAEEGNYFAPNRVIPKAQRSKWRFKVMRFIRNIQAIDAQNENFAAANELLIRLYRLMCKACTVYVFNTDDAFASIQFTQQEFYGLIAERVIGPDPAGRMSQTDLRKVLKEMLDLAVLPGVSRESIHLDQINTFVDFLDSDAALDQAQNADKELIKEKEEELAGLPAYSFDLQDYYVREAIESLLQADLMIAQRRGDAPREFAFYFDHTRERDKEVTLYCAMMYVFRAVKDWEDIVKIYDYAVKKRKIKPREELTAYYEEARNQGASADGDGQN